MIQFFTDVTRGIVLVIRRILVALGFVHASRLGALVMPSPRGLIELPQRYPASKIENDHWHASIYCRGPIRFFNVDTCIDEFTRTCALRRIGGLDARGGEPLDRLHDLEELARSEIEKLTISGRVNVIPRCHEGSVGGWSWAVTICVKYGETDVAATSTSPYR